MTRRSVHLLAAACLLAAPLTAQEVAPFAVASSTAGAEAVLLNPAALADLEGLHGYLGLQQLYQRTDWEAIEGEADRSIQAPFAVAWNLGDDWAFGIGEMPAFDGRADFAAPTPFGLEFRKFEFSVAEWRGAAAYRVTDALNLGIALRFLQADYALRGISWSSGAGGYYYYLFGAYSGNRDRIGLELSAWWKAEGFTVGALLRPEVKFDFGYGDFGVSFDLIEEVDEETEAILRTFFPGGGVATEAVLPLEARVAISLAPRGRWRFSGELGWAQWSRWNAVSLDYANETVDPATGEPVLADASFHTQFQDAFSLSGLAAFTFENAVQAYGRLGWQEAICGDPAGATLRSNDGVIATLGGRYPWKFGELTLAVDAFTTFGIYSSHNGFEMSRNLLGAGISFAY
jgi:long-subunit fatty acid transport protein